MAGEFTFLNRNAILVRGPARKSSIGSRLVDQLNCHTDHDYTYIQDRAHLSVCSQKIVVHIAGFVMLKLSNSLQCEKCISTLFGTDEISCAI